MIQVRLVQRLRRRAWYARLSEQKHVTHVTRATRNDSESTARVRKGDSRGHDFSSIVFKTLRRNKVCGIMEPPCKSKYQNGQRHGRESLVSFDSFGRGTRCTLSTHVLTIIRHGSQSHDLRLILTIASLFLPTILP